MNLVRSVCALLAAAAIASSGCAATYDHDRSARPSPPARTRVAVGIDFFYDALSPYGAWVEIAPHGWVWCPLDAPHGWRPYTVGYWVHTDSGWMWISEDPWGWIPYHYGRWMFDSHYGWVWVPDDVWAPAWVTWRHGAGWIGWAPLPPDVHWRVGVGLYYKFPELDRHIHRYDWCFSRARDFGQTRVRVRVVPANKNVTLLRVTRNVTRYRAVGSMPVEHGLLPEMIERDAGRRIVTHRIVESDTPLRERGAVVGERTVEVYRPDGRITDIVRERVRNVTPAQRPGPPARLIDRTTEARDELQNEVQRERERLREEQAQEERDRPAGMPERELRRRQQEERRAQQELEQRERRVVEERERTLKERAKRRR